MNDPVPMLLLVRDQFTAALGRLHDPDAVTPCDGWRASDVAGHVVGTMGKVLALVTGGDVAGAPADPEAAGLDAATMQERWATRVREVRAALGEADLDAERTTAYGRGPVRRQLAVPACDLAVHAWDVAASQGERLELPAEVRGFLRAATAQLPPERLRAPGMFGPETTPPADATDTERIMAFLGRDVPRGA